MTGIRIKRFTRGGLLLVLATLAACSTAPNRDADYARLQRSVDQLGSDPALGTLAPAELSRARSAVAALQEKGSNGAGSVYVAERYVDAAWAAAQATELDRKREELSREHDRLLLAAARRDAQLARAELEQQRLQAQIRAEEAQRLAEDVEQARQQSEEATEAARAEAAQAKRMASVQARAAALAKREAELSAALASGGAATAATPAKNSQMRLADSAFSTGHADLTDAGKKRVDAAVGLASSEPARKIRIAGHAATAQLARQRATTVRDALVAAGVDASRVTVTGAASKQHSVEVILEAQ